MTYTLPRGHLSHSQITTYLQCPAKYDFRYIKREPEPVNEALYLGSVFHRAQQYYFTQRLEGTVLEPIDVATAFEIYFNEGWTDDEGRSNHPSFVTWDNRRQALETGQELSRVYTESIGQHVSPLQSELSIKTDVQTSNGPVPFVSIIDLTTTDGVLIDFKTRSRAMTQADADKDLQPSFYGLAVGGPVRFEFHTALKTKMAEVQRIATQRNVGQLEQTHELVGEVAKGISAGVFPTNPTSVLCSKKWCAFWTKCMGRYQ